MVMVKVGAMVRVKAMARTNNNGDNCRYFYPFHYFSIITKQISERISYVNNGAIKIDYELKTGIKPGQVKF